MEQKLVKCEPSDPNRCQGRGDGGEGQCCFLAVPDCKYCIKHGAAVVKAQEEKKKVSMYRLQQWQQRVDEFAASPRITSLHEEIGILRLQIENIMNLCKDNQDLLMYSTRIADLVMKIDRLVSTFDKINNRSSNLLDKSAALVLAGQIVDIIGAEVKDPEAVDRISTGIIDLVAKLAGKDMDDE